MFSLANYQGSSLLILCLLCLSAVPMEEEFQHLYITEEADDNLLDDIDYDLCLVGKFLGE